MTKEELYKEADLGLEIYEKTKGMEWESFHRVNGIVSQMRSIEDRKKHAEIYGQQQPGYPTPIQNPAS